MPTLWGAEIGEELMDSVRIQRRLFANPALADAIIRADLDAPGEVISSRTPASLESIASHPLHRKCPCRVRHCHEVGPLVAETDLENTEALLGRGWHRACHG